MFPSLAVAAIAAFTLAAAAVCVAAFLERRIRPESYRRGQVEEFLQSVHCAAIVHRGGVPENTLAGIRQSAARDGARGVEVDVMLSKDEECVLLHDETVDRTSDGSGPVKDLTLEQLRGLDFGGYVFCCYV